MKHPFSRTWTWSVSVGVLSIARLTRIASAQQPMCYWEYNNHIDSAANDAPCGVGALSGSNFISCCSSGDTCLGNDICHGPGGSHPNGSGYYLSGCTDRTVSDNIACTRHCISNGYPDVVYNASSKVWACCTVVDFNVNCSNPTTETFAAPAPASLTGTWIALTTRTISTTTSAASSTTSTSPSLTSGAPRTSASVTGTTSTNPPPTSSLASSNAGLSAGASAGVGAGVACIIIILFWIGYLTLRRHQKRQNFLLLQATVPPSTIAGMDQWAGRTGTTRPEDFVKPWLPPIEMLAQTRPVEALPDRWLMTSELSAPGRPQELSTGRYGP